VKRLPEFLPTTSVGMAPDYLREKQKERISGTMSFDFPTLMAVTPPVAEGAAGHAATHAAGIDYLALLFVFMLATFTGLLVIRNVSRLLHTPLMSLTNAISAIAVVGSIALAGRMESGFTTVLGAVAVFASMTNIVSGFLLTDRMLKMFKKREPGKS
jgi:H+-translocating NAD(P) transhydrogenase subunit alpha